MIRGDPTVDFPPEEFIRVPNAILFDEHEGSRTVKGKPLVVDAARLERIAKNQNEIYRHKRCPVVVGLGHTKDSEHVKEEDQPTPVGWAVDLKTVPFAFGKKALAADLYIRKEHAHVIREYPGRSIELYPSSDEVPFLALLRSVPERNLPVLKFSADRSEEDCVRICFTPPPPPTLLDPDFKPLTFSREKDDMPSNEMDGAELSPKPEVADAQLGEGKTLKELADKISKLEQLLMPIAQAFEQMMQEPDGDEGDDLLGPAGEEEGDDDTETETPDSDSEPAVPQKDAEKKEEPVKMEASAPSATNCTVPNTITKEKDKTKMSRETEEALKFQRETAEKFAKLEKEREELARQVNRMKAEKVVAELETKERIKFGKAEQRERQVKLLTELDPESFAEQVQIIKDHFQRETPASGSVMEKLQFARTPEGEEVETMEQVQERVAKRLQKNLNDALRSTK